MRHGNLMRYGLIVSLLAAIPGYAFAQHSHEHSDTIFGPLGVATKEECDAVGGRFIPQAFGWMLHSNVFAGNDLRSIWQDDHMKHDHDAMLGTP